MQRTEYQLKLKCTTKNPPDANLTIYIENGTRKIQYKHGIIHKILRKKNPKHTLHVVRVKILQREQKGKIFSCSKEGTLSQPVSRELLEENNKNSLIKGWQSASPFLTRKNI